MSRTQDIVDLLTYSSFRPMTLRRDIVNGVYEWIDHFSRMNNNIGIEEIIFSHAFRYRRQSEENVYLNASPLEEQDRIIGMEITCNVFNKFLF